MAKRAFDVFWATAGLILLWPLFVVIAILIKLEDMGPVFFRQWRIGRNGIPFRIWKFRTMFVDAEKHGAPLTVGKDPRITRMGRWLRTSKIDELPQLMNVWVGEMSLVGPRPEVEKYVHHYSNDEQRVLRLKPGITDLASVKYRRESELLAESPDPDQTYIDVIMKEKIQINLQYASQANVWNDFKVIMLTLGLWPASRV